MLVISRKVGECVRIGDNVSVTVLEINGSTIRLGIEAPADVSIHRQEVWLAMTDENRAAAESSPDDLPTPPRT